MRLNRVTVGADPELFFKQQNRYISAIGRIGGTKKEPKPIVGPGFGEGYAIQEDNVAAEFNIPPCTTATQFSAAVRRTLKHIEKLAKQQDLMVSIVAAAHFDADQLKHPKALELGCDPDYCAWTEQINTPPVAPPSLRTAAGHIHVGWEDPQMDDMVKVIKLLDVFIGLPMVLNLPPSERRQLYGKAGAFRPKPYGVEYRVPDNFWIEYKSSRVWMFNQVIAATRAVAGRDLYILKDIEEYGQYIQDAINNHDVGIATWLVNAIFNVPHLQIPFTDEVKNVRSTRT